MAKTQRSTPDAQNRRRKEMEKQWEQQVEGLKAKHAAPAAQPREAVPAPVVPPGQVHIDALAAEAEKVLAEKAASSSTVSIQNPPPGVTASGQGLLWWSGGNIDDYIPLAEYGTQQRQRDLRAFALVAPMILIAESVLIKKMQALQWSVEAGRNRAIHWQSVLANLDQDAGWDTFIARWVRGYCESDYGGYAEILRSPPSRFLRTVSTPGNGYGIVETTGVELNERGEVALRTGQDRAWPIADARVMDPTRCLPSADPEFPLQFYNSYTGKKHYLRPYQFMHILDMPNVDDSIPRQGMCAVSRAVWAAQEDRLVTRYGFEALSENPGTGMILANVNQTLLETALESAKGERSARGAVFYKGVIFLPVLDPSGTTKLEYLTFSHLPENFNRTEDYSRIKEIVASSFGMDVLELGSIPGHNLGTSAQAEVGAAKARGKGIGALIQGVEREVRHKFLPSDVQLRIKKHDIDEQKDRAELDAVYFANATSMVQVGSWDPVMANQYLADRGAIEPEYPYMAADLTPSDEIDDTEATEKAWSNQPVRVDKDGTVHYKAHAFVLYAQANKQAKERSLREEIDVRDLVGARALWAKHVPGHAELTR